MPEKDLVDYIQARLSGKSRGQAIIIRNWLDELTTIFPNFAREDIAERLRQEARRVGLRLI